MHLSTFAEVSLLCASLNGGSGIPRTSRTALLFPVQCKAPSSRHDPAGGGAAKVRRGHPSVATGSRGPQGPRWERHYSGSLSLRISRRESETWASVGLNFQSVRIPSPTRVCCFSRVACRGPSNPRRPWTIRSMSAETRGPHPLMHRGRAST